MRISACLMLVAMMAVLRWDPILAQDEARMNAQELADLEAEVNKRLQRHYVRRRGAEDPQSIPTASKIRVLFDSAQRHGPNRDTLASWLMERVKLDAQDADALSAVVLSYTRPDGVVALEQKARQLEEELASLTDPGAHPEAAIEIGRQQNALQEQSDALWAAYFESLLTRLSTHGRRSVDQYVHQHIEPRMTNIRIDYAALYSEVIELMPQIRKLQSAGLMQVPSTVSDVHVGEAPPEDKGEASGSHDDGP